MTNHPITPPPELVHKWAIMFESLPDEKVFSLAAQWGYQQATEELETFLRKSNDAH